MKAFLELFFLPLFPNKIVFFFLKKLSRKRPDIKDATITYFKYLSQKNSFFKKTRKEQKGRITIFGSQKETENEWLNT